MPPVRTRADDLYDRMVVQGESFWSAVRPVVAARDMTRDDMRALVARGLNQSGGSYKLMLQLFNVQPQDYRAFRGFLRKYGCQSPAIKFRRVDCNGGPHADAPEPRRAQP